MSIQMVRGYNPPPGAGEMDYAGFGRYVSTRRYAAYGDYADLAQFADAYPETLDSPVPPLNGYGAVMAEEMDIDLPDTMVPFRSPGQKYARPAMGLGGVLFIGYMVWVAMGGLRKYRRRYR